MRHTLTKVMSFASVSFEAIPDAGSSQTLNYTIRVDSGLRYINVRDHNSDYELRVLPLQWAIESVSAQLLASSCVLLITVILGYH